MPNPIIVLTCLSVGYTDGGVNWLSPFKAREFLVGLVKEFNVVLDLGTGKHSVRFASFIDLLSAVSDIYLPSLSISTSSQGMVDLFILLIIDFMANSFEMEG